MTAARMPQAPALDPTLPSPEQQAAIEAAMGGVSLQDTDPALLDFLVQRCRQAGNAAFKEKRYKGAERRWARGKPRRRRQRRRRRRGGAVPLGILRRASARAFARCRHAPTNLCIVPSIHASTHRSEAVQMYSQALAGAPKDAALYANRSAAYLSLGLYEQAAWDGRKAAALRPGWAKAHYRLGCALLALSSWGAAAAALQRALELEPGSGDVAARLKEAEERAGAEAAARTAQAATERRALAVKLRAARRADHRLVQLNQFKQAMAGPEWELDDLEW